MRNFIILYLTVSVLIVLALIHFEGSRELSVEELEGKLAQVRISIQKTETLLIKRTAERDTCKAELNLLIRRAKKTPKEIMAELAKAESEYSSEAWFLEIKEAWKDLEDLERDVMIFTRQAERLNKSKKRLESLTVKIERGEENKGVYIKGEDPELDELFARGDVITREDEWDHLPPGEKTVIDIEVSKLMAQTIEKNGSKIPGLKLASVEELPVFPDLNKTVQTPEKEAQVSLLARVKKDCAKMVRQAEKEAAGHVKNKQPEVACEVWIQTIKNLRKTIGDASEIFPPKFFQEYQIALEICRNDTLLLMCKPYLETLSQSVQELKSKAHPDWDSIAESLEGFNHIKPKLASDAAQRLKEELETINGHLNYLLKQNDLVAKVKSQRLQTVIGELDGTFQHKARDRKVFTVDGVEFAFRWCPPGEFMMGSAKGNQDENPVHQVVFTKGFWLLETEVTQEMWESVMGKNPSNFQSWFRDTKKNPVENVCWNDCLDFCQKLGEKLGQTVKLPTEAQWEYACRAGQKGDYANDLNALAWYRRTVEGVFISPRQVAQKQPNAWGLYDMLGNVSEWCADYYAADYYTDSPTNDPENRTVSFYHVSRGGDWSLDANACRPTCRFGYTPESRAFTLGLRVLVVPASNQ